MLKMSWVAIATHIPMGLKEQLRQTTLWRVLSAAGTPLNFIRLIAAYVAFQLTNGLKQNWRRKPIVFALINEAAFPDAQDYRYFYFVLRTFIEAGYHLQLCQENRVSFTEYVSFKNYQRRAYHLRGAQVVYKLPVRTQDKILLTNLNHPAGQQNWQKRLTLNSDISAAAAPDTFVMMPYIMHPFQYKFGRHKQLPRLRRRPRKIRIFFSGGLQPQAYTRPLPGRKMNRVEIMQTVAALPGVEWLKSKPQLEQMLNRDYSNVCLISNRAEFVIPDWDWLPTVAGSDFFLCPTGMIMPMCHNVIEAMAVGTIPILNYPEWFNPPLVDGENCLVFSDKETLADKIEIALKMPSAKIENMRQNVVDYFERHLTPASFRQKLEQMPANRLTVFVNSDQQAYASNVTEASVIISGAME